MESGANGDSIEKLQGLQITPLDDDDEEEREMVAYEYEDDDEDDGEDEEEQEPVTLGFLEKPKNRWSLLRHLFPSKAGGPPVATQLLLLLLLFCQFKLRIISASQAWLDPINLPTGRSCLCDMCGEPLQFVLQVFILILTGIRLIMSYMTSIVRSCSMFILLSGSLGLLGLCTNY